MDYFLFIGNNPYFYFKLKKMSFERIKEKLNILADAAKYDISCSSSGSKRANKGGLGNSDGVGICHSYTGMVDAFLY